MSYGLSVMLSMSCVMRSYVIPLNDSSTPSASSTKLTMIYALNTIARPTTAATSTCCPFLTRSALPNEKIMRNPPYACQYHARIIEKDFEQLVHIIARTGKSTGGQRAIVTRGNSILIFQIRIYDCRTF